MLEEGSEFLDLLDDDTKREYQALNLVKWEQTREGGYHGKEPNPSGYTMEIGRQQAMQKAVIIPLIARLLGIDTLNLSAEKNWGKALGGDEQPRLLMKKLKAKDFESLLNEETGPDERISKIDDDQLQKTVLFDMLFENTDAHMRQYVVSESGELFKVDQEGYLLFAQKRRGGAKAGSFLAGLPQANHMLTSSTLRLVDDWDSTELEGFMRAAGIFARVQIEHVLENLVTIKDIIKPNITIRELFEKYNGEYLENFMEDAPTAMRYHFFGSRASSSEKSESKLGSLSDTEEQSQEDLEEQREEQRTKEERRQQTMNLLENWDPSVLQQ